MLTFVLLFVCGVVIPLVIFCIVIIRYKQRERMRTNSFESQLELFAADVRKKAVESGLQMQEHKGSLSDHIDIRSLWGDSPERDVVIEDVCSAHGVYDGWDYCVILHEAVEQYLGTPLFASLEFRFAEIPGVEVCRQEDRELYLIRGKELLPHILREDIWQRFSEAAGQMKQKGG